MINFVYVIFFIRNFISINLDVNYYYNIYFLLKELYEYFNDLILIYKISVSFIIVLLVIKVKIYRVYKNRNMIKW